MIVLTDESIDEILKGDPEPSRKTHLVLNDMLIYKLEFLRCKESQNLLQEPLNKYTSFEVIDLRNNKIDDALNLRDMTNITHLYLQNNSIKRLSGFITLKSLKMLFLDFNKIEVIENLENCPLKKLSIKGQRLDKSVVIGFDPLCMKRLKAHLLELVVSNNKLCTIRGIHYLKNLEILDVSDNKIEGLINFTKELSGLDNLRKLDIYNNPIVKNVACIAKTVSACQKLEYLNDRPITGQTRIYCENMYKLYIGKPKYDVDRNLIKAANNSSSNFPVSLRPRLTEKLLNEVRRKWKSQKKNINLHR